MPLSYLELAERVLRFSGKPMTAQEIVSFCKKIDRRIGGKTAEKTFQARISEDIFYKKERSKFIRLSRGVYALRSEFECEKNIIHHSIRRNIYSNNDKIFCIKKNLRMKEGWIDDEVVVYSYDDGEYFYYKRIPENYVRLGIYVIAQDRCGRIILFKIGRYMGIDCAENKFSIGYPRLVKVDDPDLFSYDKLGIDSSVEKVLYHYIECKHIDILGYDHIGFYFDEVCGSIWMCAMIRLSIDFSSSSSIIKQRMGVSNVRAVFIKDFLKLNKNIMNVSKESSIKILKRNEA